MTGGFAGAERMVFWEAVTPTPEPAGAMASLLTGRLPSRHRVSHLDPVPRLSDGFTTLPEILRAHGYATRAFVADERLRRGASLWQGCEVHPERVGLAEAPSALARWTASLPSGQPWFAVVLGDEAAPPYGESNHVPLSSTVPAAVVDSGPAEAARQYFEDARAFAALRERRWRAGGAVAVTELERELRRFFWKPQDPTPGFDAAKFAYALFEHYHQSGLTGWAVDLFQAIDTWAQPPKTGTITLYTSTGGTGFGEHGILGPGRQLYDEQVRIPFVLSGLEPQGPVQEGASLVDVLPTVLESLGLPAMGGIDGVSLLPVVRGKVHRSPVVSEAHQDGENTGDPTVQATLVSVRSPLWKYIVRFDVRAGTVVEEAYNLTVDFGEQKNLANAQGTIEGVPFPPGMCVAIERVRDGIWGQVHGANRTAEGPYSMGARVTDSRPAPCGK
jgi:hypothetical protein